MFPDPKWLDALRLPLKASVATALAAGALLLLDALDLLDLSVFGVLARPIVMVVGVIAGALAVAGIGEYLSRPITERHRQSALAARRTIRRNEEEEAREERRAQILTRLDHLSPEEIRLVAGALRAETPTFYTYVHSPPATVLIGKGLVWTTGQQHHQDHYPFSFHDFVWAELQSRRDEFLAKDEANRNSPEAIRQAARRRRRV